MSDERSADAIWSHAKKCATRDGILKTLGEIRLAAKADAREIAREEIAKNSAKHGNERVSESKRCPVCHEKLVGTPGSCWGTCEPPPTTSEPPDNQGEAGVGRGGGEVSEAMARLVLRAERQAETIAQLRSKLPWGIEALLGSAHQKQAAEDSEPPVQGESESAAEKLAAFAGKMFSEGESEQEEHERYADEKAREIARIMDGEPEPEPEGMPEPVAWRRKETDDGYNAMWRYYSRKSWPDCEPLYSHESVQRLQLDRESEGEGVEALDRLIAEAPTRVHMGEWTGVDVSEMARGVRDKVQRLTAEVERLREELDKAGRRYARLRRNTGMMDESIDRLTKENEDAHREVARLRNSTARPQVTEEAVEAFDRYYKDTWRMALNPKEVRKALSLALPHMTPDAPSEGSAEGRNPEGSVTGEVIDVKDGHLIASKRVYLSAELPWPAGTRVRITPVPTEEASDERD